jgi:hypothetical protein
MCKNSYIKLSSTTKTEMIYCHLFDDENSDMLRICRFQKYCGQVKKYIFNNENKCKRKNILEDGHEKCNEDINFS